MKERERGREVVCVAISEDQVDSCTQTQWRRYWTLSLSLSRSLSPSLTHSLITHARFKTAKNVKRFDDDDDDDDDDTATVIVIVIVLTKLMSSSLLTNVNLFPLKASLVITGGGTLSLAYLSIKLPRLY